MPKRARWPMDLETTRSLDEVIRDVGLACVLILSILFIFDAPAARPRRLTRVDAIIS